MSAKQIDIAIFGAVSAGKSTFLNALFAQKLSDMARRRTTAMPQIYHSDTGGAKEAKDIHADNKKRNASAMEKTARGGELKIDDIKDHSYHVGPAPDMFELRPGVHVAVHDLPGLNDAKTKGVYIKYIHRNFHRYAVVLFVVDVNSALNTSDEMEILNMILAGIASNAKQDIDTKCIILINKCDDMIMNARAPDGLKLADAEYADMEKQIRTIVAGRGAKDVLITKISSEDMFVYRVCKHSGIEQLNETHIDKLGTDEFGKSAWRSREGKSRDAIRAILPKIIEKYDRCMTMCGFAALRKMMAAMLTEPTQMRFLLNTPYRAITSIPRSGDETTWLGPYRAARGQIKSIAAMFGVAPTAAEYAPISKDAALNICACVGAKMVYITDCKSVPMSLDSYVDHLAHRAALYEINSFIGSIDPGMEYLRDATIQLSDAIAIATANIGGYHRAVLADITTTPIDFRVHMKLAADEKQIVGDFAAEMTKIIMPTLATRPGWVNCGKHVVSLIHEFVGHVPGIAPYELIFANIKAQFAGILRDIAPGPGKKCRDIAQIRANMIVLRETAMNSEITDVKYIKYITYIAEFANTTLYGNRGAHYSGNGRTSCLLSVCIDSFDGPLIAPTIHMELIDGFIFEIKRITASNMV